MFGFKVFILELCLLWCHCISEEGEYCSLSPEHTMCIYKGFGKACKSLGSGGVTEGEKIEILKLHNRFRNLLAGGYDPRGKEGLLPKAADMRKMVWDDELQAVAQRWADQCTEGQDSCRNVERWQVGQNTLWWDKPKPGAKWTEVIYTWLGWGNNFSLSQLNSFDYNDYTSCFTQMIWHDTYTIGCGRRFFGSAGKYVCNYGPDGNRPDESIYTVGDPCTKCPKGTICEDYLCALPAGPRNNSVADINIQINLIKSVNIGSQPAVSDKDVPRETGKHSKTNVIQIDRDISKEIDDIKNLIDYILKPLKNKNIKLLLNATDVQ